MMILTYLSIVIINSVSVIIYAITSFGNGVLYQLGWHLCYLIASNVCDGLIDTVVIHVTVAHVFTFPMQLYLLRHRINWILALILTVSQQGGLYVGLFLLFQYPNSIWLFRGLALLFFLTAVDMIYKEMYITINDNNNNKNQMNMISSNDSDDSNINKIKIELITTTTNNIYGGDDIVELGIGGTIKSKTNNNSQDSNNNSQDSNSNSQDSNSNSNIVIDESKLVQGDHKFFVIDTYSKFFITTVAGILSGVSSGMFSIGGPSLMWLITFYKLDSVECRATLAVCFWFENIGKLVYIFFLQDYVDVWNSQFLVLFIVLTVSSVSSLLLGNHIARYVSQTMFRRILTFLLSSGSVLMAINGLDGIQTLIVSGLSLLFLCIILATSYMIATKQNECINRLCCLHTENEIDKSLDRFMNCDSLSDDDDKEMNTLFGNKKTSTRIGSSPTSSPRSSPNKKIASIFQRSLYSVLTTEENNDSDERSDNVLF